MKERKSTMSEIVRPFTNEEIDAITNELFEAPSQKNEPLSEMLAELDLAESGGQAEGDSED